MLKSASTSAVAADLGRENTDRVRADRQDGQLRQLADLGGRAPS